MYKKCLGVGQAGKELRVTLCVNWYAPGAQILGHVWGRHPEADGPAWLRGEPTLWTEEPLSRCSGQALLWASTVSSQLAFPNLTHWKVMGGSCGRGESSNLKSQNLGSSPAPSTSWTGAHAIAFLVCFPQALQLCHLDL